MNITSAYKTTYPNGKIYEVSSMQMVDGSGQAAARRSVDAMQVPLWDLHYRSKASMHQG